MRTLNSLLFITYVILYFASTVSANLWSWFHQNDQVIISSYQASDIPQYFTARIPCESYLSNVTTTLIYNYGVSEDYDHTGTDQLACLSTNSSEGSAARGRITDVIIAFPVLRRFAVIHNDLQSLIDLTIMLKLGLANVRFPCSEVGRWFRGKFIKNLRSENSFEDLGHAAECYPVAMGGAFTPSIECAESELKIRSGIPEEHEGILNKAYYVLTSCPDMKKLDMSLTRPGYIAGPDCPPTISYDQRAFDFRIGDIFPDLEELRLEGYGFDTDENGLVIESFDNSVHVQSKRYGQMAAFGKSTFDFASLRKLDIDLPPNVFLEYLSSPGEKLKSLESLTLRPKAYLGERTTICGVSTEARDTRQRYTNWIARLNPLKELCLSGLGKQLDLATMLNHHGPRLESFRLHHLEFETCGTGHWIPSLSDSDEKWGRPHCNSSCINEILAHAPGLRVLELDIFRTSPEAVYDCQIAENFGTCVQQSLDWDALSTLTAFTHLENLTLHFDLFHPTATFTSQGCLQQETEIATRTCVHNKKYEGEDDPMCVEHSMQNFNLSRCEARVEFGMRLDTQVAQHIFELFRKTTLQRLKIGNGDFGIRKRDYGEEWMDDGIPGKIVCSWEGYSDQKKGSVCTEELDRNWLQWKGFAYQDQRTYRNGLADEGGTVGYRSW
jgi:hypothetical protein